MNKYTEATLLLIAITAISAIFAYLPPPSKLEAQIIFIVFFFGFMFMVCLHVVDNYEQSA